jgi:hypothetical protein
MREINAEVSAARRERGAEHCINQRAPSPANQPVISFSRPAIPHPPLASRRPCPVLIPEGESGAAMLGFTDGTSKRLGTGRLPVNST